MTAPIKREKRIGEVLLEQDAITRDELKEALAVQKERGGRLCQVLINLGYLSEETLLACIGNQTGIVSVNLRQYTIDPALREFVPQEFAVKYELMPLDKLGNNLTVAMAVPMDMKTRKLLEEQTGLRVRAVLCSRSDVHATIEQYYGVSPTVLASAAGSTPPQSGTVEPESMAIEAPADADVEPGPEAVRLRGVLDILESVDHFPLLPEVHIRVIDAIQAPEAEVAEITDLISQDPTLATNILKIANSAAYAARSEFDSVQRAIAYIGLRELHGIVVGTAVMNALNAQTSFDLNRLFLRAFHCGLLTKIISDTADLGDRDMAFTAGLLHNIGNIAVRIFSEERVQRIEQVAAESGRTAAEVEAEMLGLTASEVGYQLTKRWKIPESLGKAIRFHDRLDADPDMSPVALAIALALHCMERDDTELGFHEATDDAVMTDLLERLGLSAEQLTRIESLYREGMASLVRLDPSIT